MMPYLEVGGRGQVIYGARAAAILRGVVESFVARYEREFGVDPELREARDSHVEAHQRMMARRVSSDVPQAGSAAGSAPDTGPMMRVMTAADATGLSREYLGRLARRGRIPGARQDGTGWLLPAAEVRRLARERKSA